MALKSCAEKSKKKNQGIYGVNIGLIFKIDYYFHQYLLNELSLIVMIE